MKKSDKPWLDKFLKGLEKYRFIIDVVQDEHGKTKVRLVEIKILNN